MNNEPNSDLSSNPERQFDGDMWDDQALKELGLLREELEQCKPAPDETIQTIPPETEQGHLARKAQIHCQTVAGGDLEQSGETAAAADYEIVKLLESNNKSASYEARQTSLDRIVALKMTTTAASGQPDSAVLKEVLVAAGLEHPNILPIHDLALDGQGRLFYAMKQIEGTYWSETIEDNDLWYNLDILLKVCDAVAFAHSRGVVHRNLKPGNIMLGHYGEVLIMDWDLAVDITGTGRADALHDTPELCGTPLYMAPEMARGRTQDIGRHSDIYLLGAILYEIITGHPPRLPKERIWDCIEEAARNVIEPMACDDELSAIAYKAMAQKPADRFVAVRMFRDAIEQFRHHEDSIQLAVDANEALAQAEEEQDAVLFKETITDFRQSLKMWPGNRHAESGLNKALLAYARCALKCDDVALAAQLLEKNKPEHRECLEQVERRRNHLRTKARRRLATRLAAAALIAVLLVFAVWTGWRTYMRHAQWELLQSWDFTRPDVDMDALFFSERDMHQSIAPFPATAQGMELLHHHTVWLRDIRVRHSVRLDLEAIWQDNIDGLELMINTRWDQPPNASHVPPGYSCLFGGWNGHYSLISRNERMRQPKLIDAIKLHFEPGRVYRLSFRRNGDEVSLWVNGRKVHRQLFVLPLEGDGLECVALRTWSPNLLLRSLCIYRKRLPRRTEPLLVGDTMYAAGYRQAAIRQYLHAAADFSGTPVEEKALSKAYIATCRIPGQMENEKARARTTMARKYPQSPYWVKMLEADSIAAWGIGEFQRALDLAGEVYALNPESHLAVAILDTGVRDVPCRFISQLLHWIAQTRRITRLDLSGQEIQSLEPLADMPLNYLSIKDNRIEDLTPLAGMPLLFLDCSFNPVSDLNPLRTLKLERLKAQSCRISDLSPLRDMPLDTLDIRQNQVQDLTPLKDVPLRNISFSFNAVSDLEPLRGKALERLSARDNALADLEPLKGMPLTHLVFSGNRVENLAPLRGMRLNLLNCANNRIKSLEPLRGVPLKTLICSRNEIRYLDALVNMPLQVLECSDNLIQNLEPLHGAPLRELNCANNNIAVLSPLRGMDLRQLHCDGNQVTTLRPLAGMHLETLTCRDNPLVALDPFDKTQPPRLFLFDDSQMDAIDVEQTLQRWEQTLAGAAIVREMRTLRALRLGDAAMLRNLASCFGNQRYLLVRKTVTWYEARDLAAAAGGHLPTITSAEEQAYLASLLKGGHNAIWLGLIPDPSGKDTWMTGEPMTYANYLHQTDRHAKAPRLLSHFWNNGRWYCAQSPLQTIEAFVIEWDR